MVERLDLLREVLTPARAAKIATEDTDGIVDIEENEKRTKVKARFESGAPLEVEYLIKKQGFFISYDTATEEKLEVYNFGNR